MPPSATAISSSGFFRSCSQKNLASDRRARITFSLPAMISLPPSLACRLVTSRNLLASLPERGCLSEKHFWCCFIDSIRHSAGTARNASSKVPISTVGHSVSPAFSLSSASSSTSASLCSLASACAWLAISAARALASRITLCVSRPLGVVERALHRERLVAVEAMPARGVAALHALDLERHHLAVEQADDGMQRPHPGGPARAPAHRLRPRELGRHRRHHLGDDLLGRAAGLLEAGDVVVALLLVLGDLGVLDRLEARRLQEARQRLLRRADARALALLADRRRLQRHVLDHQRQPARRGVGLRLADAEPLRLQALRDQTFQVVGRARLHARRDLFGKQLEEQLSHGGNHRSFGNGIGRAEPLTEAPPAKPPS